MQAPYFPDWRGVYHSEHLPGILCTCRNMLSGYIPELNNSWNEHRLKNILNRLRHAWGKQFTHTSWFHEIF